MNEDIEQFTKRADEFDKGQLVIGRAELDIILNDNYISKEEVEKNSITIPIKIIY